jgi:putative copper resistance protein D
LIAALLSGGGIGPAEVAVPFRAAWYAATLGGAGLALLAAGFGGAMAAGDIARLRRWRALALPLGLAAAAGALGAAVAELAGGAEGLLDRELWGIVLLSPAGRAFGAGLAGLALLAASRRGVALAGALLACGSFLLSGHTAGAGPLPALLLLLHLLAAAFWIGSLPVLAWIARRDGRAAAPLVAGWSRRAASIVPALLLAGIGLAWLLAGRLGALVDTRWGLFLLVKAALVAGMLLFAAWNRWRLVPALERGQGEAGSRLARSIALEAVLAALVLLAAAELVTTPPNARLPVG